ncbi:hypothetical protein BJF78_19735 [Pseudonocardia sp. CNS-139]|nr:hypothetical protein BJF78_19735 [Pseudonocardia sp. CNS-139]
MPDHRLHWTKASHSTGIGACVEIAPHGTHIAVRNSRHPGVHIRFPRAEFAVFLSATKNGEFDRSHTLDPA